MKQLFTIIAFCLIAGFSFAGNQNGVLFDSVTRHVATTNLTWDGQQQFTNQQNVFNGTVDGGAGLAQFNLFATNAYSVTTNGVTTINYFPTCQAMLQSCLSNDPALIVNTNVFMSQSAGGIYHLAPGLIYRFENPISALVFSNYPSTYIFKQDFGNMSYLFYDGPTNQQASALTFAWYKNATNQAADDASVAVGYPNTALTVEFDHVGFATYDATNVFLYVGAFNMARFAQCYMATYGAWTNHLSFGSGFEVNEQYEKNVTLLKCYTHIDNGVFIDGGYFQGGAIQIWVQSDKWQLHPWYVTGNLTQNGTNIVVSCQQDGVLSDVGFIDGHPCVKVISPPFFQGSGYITFARLHPDLGIVGAIVDYKDSDMVPGQFGDLDGVNENNSISTTPLEIPHERFGNSGSYNSSWWNMQTTNLQVIPFNSLGQANVNYSKVYISGVPSTVNMAGLNGSQTFIFSYTNSVLGYEVLTNANDSSIPNAATNCIVMWAGADPDDVNNNNSWVICPSNNISGAISTEYFFIVQGNQFPAITGGNFIDFNLVWNPVGTAMFPAAQGFYLPAPVGAGGQCQTFYSSVGYVAYTNSVWPPPNIPPYVPPYTNWLNNVNSNGVEGRLCTNNGAGTLTWHPY